MDIHLHTLRYGIMDCMWGSQAPFFQSGTGRSYSRLEVMPNGDVYPCCLSLGIQKFRLGNINETTLCKVWNSPLLHGFRNREEMVPPESRCRECSFFALCKGGCFMSSLYAFGRIQGDPACPVIRGIENE